MKRYILLSLLLLQLQVLSAQEYPKLIMPGDYPDPSIIRDGKDYYMTHSTFNYKPGFVIWHSQNLYDWEPIASVPGAGGAPDLVKYKDKYYIYYATGESNYVIWAANIIGPWSNPNDLKLKSGDGDPGHLADVDGNRYLYLSQGQAVRLSADGLSTLDTLRTVYKPWVYPANWVTECVCLESPKLFYKDGYYYMTSAEGGTAGPATSHMVVSARSRNPMGPWENSPYNPIVHTYNKDENWWSKGHGTIIDDVNGNWWIVYHAYAKDFYTLGRSTLLEPIEWTKDGWFRTKTTAIRILSPGPAIENGLKLSDNFDHSKLGFQWKSWGWFTTAEILEKNNSLYLQGKGLNPKDGRLVLTIPTDKNYETQVEVNIGAENTAGLLLYYSQKAYMGVSSNGKSFTIYNNANDEKTIPNKLGSHFFLKIVNESNKCKILISQNNSQWDTVAENIDVKDMNHNKYGGFYSLRIALFSCGKGTGQFKKFEYKAE